MKTTGELYSLFLEACGLDGEGTPLNIHAGIMAVLTAVQDEPHSYLHKVGSKVEVSLDTLERIESLNGILFALGNPEGILRKVDGDTYHVEFRRGNGSTVKVPIPRRDVLTKAPKWFPKEEVLSLRMTRALAEQRGLLVCRHCGYPRNNHFDHGNHPCAHDSKCPGYEEDLRAEV